MRDRVARHTEKGVGIKINGVGQQEHQGAAGISKGAGGLDFMVYDEGIRQQIIANVPQLMAQQGKQTLEVPGQKIKFKIPVSRKNNAAAFWQAYFNAKEGLDIKTIGQVQKYVKNVNNKNWKEFQEAVEDFVTSVLGKVFVGKGGSEDKVRPVSKQFEIIQIPITYLSF
jgi:hypothetical protein